MFREVVVPYPDEHVIVYVIFAQFLCEYERTRKLKRFLIRARQYQLCPCQSRKYPEHLEPAGFGFVYQAE